MRTRSAADNHLLQQSISDIVKSIDAASMRLLSHAVVIVIISALFLSLSPLYMAKIIDATTTVHGDQPSHNIIVYAFIYLALRFAGQAFVDLRWIAVNPVLYTISYSLCALTASRLSNIFRHEGRTGDNAAVIAEQVSVMSKMGLGSISLLYGVLAVIIPTIIEMLIVCTAIGVVIGPWLALYIALGGIVFMIGVSFKRDKELSSANSAHQLDNIVSTCFAEYISNPSLVREFGANGFMKERLTKTITTSIFQHRRLFFIKAERGLYLTAITLAVYSSVLFGTLLKGNAIPFSAGSLFLVVIYLDRTLQPLTSASAAINNIQTGLVSMRGAYMLLEKLKEEAARKPFNFRKNDKWKSISLSKERHFYAADQVLHIGQGLWIRLHGPSGSGKSTYLRQMYHRLLSDKIYIGTDIHYLNPVPAIIRGSIFDNITLGDSLITREMTQRYWLMWHVKLRNSPIDIDTDVQNLSAGEMQFLAICRTLVRNPKLVIFDEATNSIDAASEPMVWAIIKKYLPKTTIFVVSHRPINTDLFDYEETLSP